MAGTGDEECFRMLRVLRKRFESDMHYGFNMALNMALGFLFLGSGGYTFSQSNLSCAALLCALYPHFPQSPSDNRYHLQALRHFYTLAIETRLLQTKDIESGEYVSVPIEVDILKGDQWGEQVQKIYLKTPAMLEDFSKIVCIRVNNDRYLKQTLAIQNWHTKGRHSRDLLFFRHWQPAQDNVC